MFFILFKANINIDLFLKDDLVTFSKLNNKLVFSILKRLNLISFTDFMHVKNS